MKKLTLIALFGALTWYWWNSKEDGQKQSSADSTPKDCANGCRKESSLMPGTDSSIKRSPASYSPDQIPSPESFQPKSVQETNARRLWGSAEKTLDLNDIKTINSPSKDWSERLQKTLKDGISGNATKRILHQGGFLMKNSDAGIYVEHVIIETISEQGVRSSYEALVDSESGKVIQTWGATQFRNHPSPVVHW